MKKIIFLSLFLISSEIAFCSDGWDTRGVSKIVAGSGVSISPTSGLGSVTIESTAAAAGIYTDGSTQTKIGGLNVGGSFGIGTTTPTSALEVFNGSVTIRGTNSALIVNSGNGIFLTGSVGIGTLVPGDTFEVGTSAAGSTLIGTSQVRTAFGGAFRTKQANNLAITGAGNASGFMMIGGDTTQRTAMASPGNDLALYTGGTTDVNPNERMRITSGGLVAIGTNPPSSLLDVFGGSITVRGTNAGIRVTGGTVTANNFSINSNSIYVTTMPASAVNIFGSIIVFSTASVAANTTLTVTPPCPAGTTFVAPISLSIYNSAAVAAGGVEFGAYNFGDATLPIINRDLTDAKNVIYNCFCR
mgnify:CR=1 FL=1